MTTSVHVQLLLGRRVYDTNGKVAGRIFEILAERRGAFCFVEGYVLGTAGLLSRLGISSLRLFGLRSRREPVIVPWRLMDLSDPGRPLLRGPIEEISQRRVPSART